MMMQPVGAPSRVAHARLRLATLVVVSALSLVIACTGQIGDAGRDPINPGDHPGAGGSGSGGPGTGGTGLGGAPVDPETGMPVDVVIPFVGLRRLSRLEYDNTVRDLLGTNVRPADDFPRDAPVDGFENNIGALAPSTLLLDLHGKAARTLVDEVVAGNDNGLLVCDPVAGGDACVRQILEGFVPRAWRRPAAPVEIDGLMDLVAIGTTNGEDGIISGLKAALRAVLMSPHFLYRVELDANPTSAAEHAVGPYEMASRLSYLLWASMPDAALFAAAAANQLATSDQIESQIARLLADPRAAGFMRAFVGGWLEKMTRAGAVSGIDDHVVDPQTYPQWNSGLAQAMQLETENFFKYIVDNDRPATELLTANYAVLNSQLAQHYGVAGFSSAAFGHTAFAADFPRGGILRQGTYLTISSHRTSTSAVDRGVWILTNVLCEAVPPPPPDVPLDQFVSGNTSQKERLAQHRADPACGVCHGLFDAFGLAFENYDGIGRYRSRDDNDIPVDASGQTAEGTPFAGPDELVGLLGNDTRFPTCVARKLFTYAFGRKPIDTDTGWIDYATGAFGRAGHNLNELVNIIATGQPFRLRRGDDSAAP